MKGLLASTAFIPVARMPGTDMNTVCPRCGQKHEVASLMMKSTEPGGDDDDHDLPSDGRLTLCIKCGHWAFFDSTAPGGLRKPTAEEQTMLRENPHLRRMVRAWRRTRKDMKRK